MRILSIFKLLTIIIIFSFQNLLAQDAPIYKWKEYMPYRYGMSIEYDGNNVFCITRFNVFSYNINEGTYQFYSKLKGLSDVEIKTSAYNAEHKLLILGYDNGNIDLLFPEKEIVNISDLKNKQTTYIKSIKSIYTKGDYAYLSTGLGIIVVDLVKKEIKDTYSIYDNLQLLSVNDFEEFNEYYYAATEKGIYKISKNSPNLSNYLYWTRVNDIPSADKNFNQIEVFENMLFANLKSTAWNSDVCYYLDSNKWKYNQYTANTSISFIAKSSNYLFIIKPNDILVFNKKMEMIENFKYDAFNISTWPSDIIEDKWGNFWISDYSEGLIKHIRNNGIYNEKLTPNGSFFNFASSFAFTPTQTYVTIGSRNTSWGNADLPGLIMIKKDNLWDTLSLANKGVKDINRIVVNPQNYSFLYASSIGKGVLEIKNDKLNFIYNDTNSSLDDFAGWPHQVQTFGLNYDINNNLWIVNYGANNLLSVKQNNGKWKSFGFSYYNLPAASDVFICKNNYKWILLPRSMGIIVFNDNNTIENTSDDKSILLTSDYGRGKLPNNSVNAIVEDKEGKIWVGTSEGLAVFYNSENIFTNYNFDAQPITIEQDGKPQHLLAAENVTAIAVDAANRKWVGTQSAGIFLFSPDGQQEIYHFTKDNSPLLSNSISAIGINPYNGEVYISTENCIVSFKGDATEGLEKYTDVYAYPNPVKEDFVGPVAIKGLITDSDVKITDVNGNLVYITKAMGGQAIWNGMDLNNRKVNTGVYLVFCTNEDGSESVVTKILFLKK